MEDIAPAYVAVNDGDTLLMLRVAPPETAGVVGTAEVAGVREVVLPPPHAESAPAQSMSPATETARAWNIEEPRIVNAAGVNPDNAPLVWKACAFLAVVRVPAYISVW